MTIGNGLLITKHAQLAVIGTTGNIPTVNFEVINKTNFSSLLFIPEIDGLLTFNENTGEFILKDSGILQLDATLNVQADQASAEFQLIPEFDEGSGWTPGIPRKAVLTAIKPDQLPFHGSKYFTKGTKIRFCVKAVSGNICFLTETLDPGGPLESVIPAAIFYLELDRLTIPIQ